MNWRVIHWVSYLCMKFIVHSFGPLRASKTLQDAHVFVWGWWPKRPMIVVFFTTVPVTKCDHGTEDCCAQHRCRLGTFGTALPRSELFASEQIKGCNVHATGPTVPLPTGNWIIRDVFLLFNLSQLSPRTAVNWSKTTIWINGGVPSFHLDIYIYNFFCGTTQF